MKIDNVSQTPSGSRKIYPKNVSFTLVARPSGLKDIKKFATERHNI